MNKIIVSALLVLASVSFAGCERKTTTIIHDNPAPVVVPENPGVKIKINDGNGSGVDVNIPTKK